MFRFFKKFWRLYHNENNQFCVDDSEPSKAELKILHQTIKKVTEDIERFSFNTSVSTFMICANELASMKCNKRAVLEPLAILIAPFAPHIAEELWHLLRSDNQSVCDAKWPEFDEKNLVEDSFTYPLRLESSPISSSWWPMLWPSA